MAFNISRSAVASVVCVCALCILLASCSGLHEQTADLPEASESVMPSAAAPTETEQEATALPTAESTVLSTAEPFVPVASCDPGYEGKYVIRSSYDWWLEETCRAILEGRLSDVEFPEHVDKYVRFAGDSSHEFVNATSSSVMIYHGGDGTGEPETVNDYPVLKIPYDIAVKAQNRLYDLLEEIGIRMTQRSDELFFECEGFCGEDWFLLQSEYLNNVSQHIHTIWRRDENGSWYEFGSNNTDRPSVSGVRILSDTAGFMSCYSFLYEEGQACRFFATFDGGVTWRDMELDLPDEYKGYNMYSHYGPVFFGEYGIVLACASYETAELEYTVRRGCFVTSDGGHSWQFMALDNG